MVELVLHIGDMKAGTTSIQSALLKQGWSGSERKLCYPVSPGQPNHHDLVELIRMKERVRVRGWFDHIRHLIDESDPDVVVISSELLEEFPAAQILEIFARHLPEFADEMRVLAYVRPHAERALSSWSQQVKLGFFSEGIEAFVPDFLARGKLNYFDRLNAWRNELGRRFTLRPMIPDQLLNGDVVQDCMARILRGETLSFPAGTRINETLSIADLALLRRLHRHPQRYPDGGTFDVRMRMGEYLGYILAAAPRPASPRPAMSRAAYERIFETCADDAAMLDRSFFGRPLMSEALKAAGRRLSEQGQSLNAEDHLTPEELRLVDGLGGLLHEMMRSAPKPLNEMLMGRIYATMRGSDPEEDGAREEKRAAALS